MKTCAGCKQTKDKSEFGLRTAAKDGLDWSCKDCNKARGRADYYKNLALRQERGRISYQKNKDLVKERARRIKRRYNLTVEQYDEMLSKGCAVCGTLENLHMDHDHACCPSRETCGKCIRGVLCRPHNTADGSFKTIEEIEKYLSYRKGYANR